MPPKGYRTDGLARGWNQDQITYMRWLCWPESDIEPAYQSKNAIADLLGVESDTLRNWERLPGWDDAVNAMGCQVLIEFNHKIYKNLIENMISHKPSDKIIQTYFRYILPAVERTRPVWEKNIQLKGEKSLALEGHRDALTREIMELPADVRDTLLVYWRRLIAEPEAGEAQVLPAPKVADFTRTNRQQAEEKRLATRARQKAQPLTFLPIQPKKPQTEE